MSTCWVPGPEGNSIMPDFLAVHVTGVTGKMKMKCASVLPNINVKVPCSY